jgi:hypothetical protein
MRCPAVAAALTWPEACRQRHHHRTLRRWQLAAEAGGGLGLLVRPASVRGEPSWAEVRLEVEPRPAGDAGPFRGRRFTIHVRRCHGGTGGGSIEAGIDEDHDETRLVHLAAPLAEPADRRGTAC